MTIRTDIQALRGLAVLQVIAFHAGHGYVQTGYLGVDIFFVVSGFLITGMITSRIDNGTFSFPEFYFNRAKRLLPAAYTTFLATTIAAFFLLDSREWQDFAAQLAGGVTFTGNIVLQQQTGYFEGAALLKPLLHIWSLAIEEQYYLLWPALLFMLPSRAWLGATLLILCASLGLQLVLQPTHPSEAFYLLPTRAWELAIGALAAVATRKTVCWSDAPVVWLFWPALLALLVIPLHPLGLGANAMLIVVCLATMVVIVRRHPVLNTNLVSQGLARVGDFSYSLYLVHWPVYAFINNIYAGDPALGQPTYPVLVGAAAASMLGAYALYRAVELPVRHMTIRPTWPTLVSLLGASVLLALLPYAINRILPDSKTTAADFAFDRRDNLGFADTCDNFKDFVPLKECQNADHPRVMVWGDSYAMQLVPGIAATSTGGVIQATKSACGPSLGLAQIVSGAYSRDYAINCLSFNQAVFDYLAGTPSIEVVALSSPFYPYFDSVNRRMLHEVNGALMDKTPSMALALQVFGSTIARIRALGKRVVIVAPPPSTGFDYTHCLERRATGRTLSGHLANCNMPLAQYRSAKAEVLDFLDVLKVQTGIDVISFDALLCSTDECVTALEGTAIYRDEGHFSYKGSKLVANAMSLGNLIESHAR
jgi:peptidoglycan/LPS O-acetylase OafA/YrhL